MKKVSIGPHAHPLEGKNGLSEGKIKVEWALDTTFYRPTFYGPLVVIIDEGERLWAHVWLFNSRTFGPKLCTTL